MAIVLKKRAHDSATGQGTEERGRRNEITSQYKARLIKEKRVISV
jgi:hypothetical protein